MARHQHHIVEDGKVKYIFSTPKAFGYLSRYKFRIYMARTHPTAKKISDKSKIGFHYVLE